MALRRELLTSVASGAVVVVAGCSGSGPSPHELTLINVTRHEVTATVRVFAGTEPIFSEEVTVPPDTANSERSVEGLPTHVSVEYAEETYELTYEPPSDCPSPASTSLLLTFQDEDVQLSYGCTSE